MAIVIISSTSAALRKEVAENLAGKLGYPCLGREELVDRATEAGIPVGKLEMSVIKSPAQSEGLARLKERYLAFITAGICEQAGQGNLVYHGRGGHLLLPNVSHVFRVRLVPNREYQIQGNMLKLRMDRPKAEKYDQQVNEDIERWVHVIHNQDMNDPRQYDLVLNLENMSIANTGAALCAMVELPDFRPTPASLTAMGNYCLSARARMTLALNERTSWADLTVSANEGVLTVTYMPRQAQVAQSIPEVLAGLGGVKEVLATMAETNILWIQEAFNPQSETFTQINQIAQRWGAAIELLRFIPSEEMVIGDDEENLPLTAIRGTKEETYSGGIGEDTPEVSVMEDGGLNQTLEELIRQGRSGGGHLLQGTFPGLSKTISRNVNYSLVVIGDIFMTRSKAVQTRMLRDLKVFLGEHIRIPVISSDELQKKYFLGGKQLIKFFVFILLVLGIYWGLFTNQESILSFLQQYKGSKLLAVVAVGLFAPVFAYLYGTIAHVLLKLIKLD
ncbi:MAG: cytidylate kinase-like family protein [Deltaproteobacteria bacterium]|nr:cytidylate kinase-like family protein [Deltaproteobacteria bacterium]